MHRLLIVMGALFAALMFSGCAEPAVFSEALQMKEGDKVYTACNIWYEDPEKIDCRNIQRGSFIPIGTEIEPVETTNFTQKIIFKDRSGKQYVIRFSEDQRLCPMSDYIAYTFTTETRDELFKGIPDKARLRIVRGEVVPGMDRRQVLLAFGPPPAIRTPDRKNETWIYWMTDAKTIRLIFRGDIVRQVMDVDL